MINIDELKLDNIKNNENLSKKLNLIIDDKNIESKYEKCQVMLEYININFIINFLNENLKDYNIIRIIEVYRKVDENLYNQMKGINSTYNIIDERTVEEDDIEYLLLKIDYIYGYIKEKYADILSK